MAYRTEDGQTFYNEGEAQAHANKIGEERERREMAGLAAQAKREEEERRRQARIKASVEKAVECRNKGDLDGAISAYYEAVKEGDTSYYLNIGEVYEQKGDLDEAISVYLKAIGSAGDSPCHINVAEVYVKKGNTSEAVKHYTEYIQYQEVKLVDLEELIFYARKKGQARSIPGWKNETKQLRMETIPIVKRCEQISGKKYRPTGYNILTGQNSVVSAAIFALPGGIGLGMAIGWVYLQLTGAYSFPWPAFLIAMVAAAVFTFIKWRNRSKLIFPLMLAAVFGWLVMFGVVPEHPAFITTQTLIKNTSPASADSVEQDISGMWYDERGYTWDFADNGTLCSTLGSQKREFQYTIAGSKVTISTDDTEESFETYISSDKQTLALINDDKDSGSMRITRQAAAAAIATPGKTVIAAGSGIPVYTNVSGNWLGDIIAVLSAGDAVETAVPPDKRGKYTKVLLEDGTSGFVSLSDVRSKKNRLAGDITVTGRLVISQKSPNWIMRELAGANTIATANEGDTVTVYFASKNGYTQVKYGDIQGWVRTNTLKKYATTQEAYDVQIAQEAAAEAAALEESYVVKKNEAMYKRGQAAYEHKGVWGVLSRLFSALGSTDDDFISIKTLAKGAIVSVTGETDYDGKVVEITHDGDTGWVWANQLRVASQSDIDNQPEVQVVVAAIGEPTAPPQMGILFRNDRNLMSEPSSGTVLQELKVGTIVTLTNIKSPKRGWVSADYNGESGWIASSNIRKVDPDGTITVKEGLSLYAEPSSIDSSRVVVATVNKDNRKLIVTGRFKWNHDFSQFIEVEYEGTKGWIDSRYDLGY